MSWLEFIARLAHSLAWPIAMMIIVITTVRTLRHSLAGILNRFGELSYEHNGHKFSAQFQRRVEVVQAQTCQIEPSDGEMISATVLEFESVQTPPVEASPLESATDFFEIFESVAKAMPVAAVTVAWAQLEHEIRATAETFNVTNAEKQKNIVGLLLALYGRHVIDSNAYHGTKELFELRNMVTHKWSLARDLTYDQVHLYLVAAQNVITRLRQAREKKSG